MFKRLIIASEISSAAFDMLNCLKSLRKLGAEDCLLVQCLDPRETKAAISSLVSDVLEETLRKQKELLTEQGYAVETRVVSGLMKNEINRIAVEEDFSIIVAGSAEHSLLGEIILGGVAHEVIHHADRPVLLIRISENTKENYKQNQDCDLTAHVLFPTDFSDNADIAFEYVKKMVAAGVKRVTLVHIQDLSRINPYLLDRLEEFDQIDADRLEKMKTALLDCGEAEIGIQMLKGSPSLEIIRLIGEHKISLVVMGSQGRGYIKELYLGSVSHNVARHSSASVLLIPAKRDSE